MSRWLQEKATDFLTRHSSRRSFLTKSAVVGTALAANPVEYILKPTSAYAAICSCGNMGCDCGSACCDGWTEFCCTINGFNGCPYGTLAGGWWKADANSYCGGAARYYIDCNVQPGYSPCSCGCANGNCGNRRACCTQFRYGQCHQEYATLGPIMCRVVSCTPPWVLDPTCTTTALTDNRTGAHNAPCLQAPPPPPPPPPKPIHPDGPAVRRDITFYLRISATQGVADRQYLFGNAGDIPVSGDWDGNGFDGTGVYRDGWWYLRNSSNAGPADGAIFFGGQPGDIPITGDWDGDGIDGIGIVRGDHWYLRNFADGGDPQISFIYGNPGDIPVVGDWNGDGRDGIGVVRGDRWYLRNTASTGVAEWDFYYGNWGDKPVVGDWNGDGVDGIGVVRNGQWFLRNFPTTGVAEWSFYYGDAGDRPLVGKW